jgi:K+-sensing histidine kinase KdpD
MPAADLLRGIAHDMRAPLSGALALLDMLAGGSDGVLEPAQVSRLRRVREQLERLGKLAAEIADLAAIESGHLRLLPGPVPIAEALTAARQNLAPMLKSRGMELQVSVIESLPRALADERRLQQALAALIHTASRATSSTGLELTAEPAGGSIRITLRETHRGMPVEALAREAAAANGDLEAARGLEAAGTLLDRTGISAARSLLALQGGTLTWRPDPAGDTVALVTLPAEPVVGGEASRPLERPRETRRQSS